MIISKLVNGTIKKILNMQFLWIIIKEFWPPSKKESKNLFKSSEI
jgi:hypothetical protein